jgi:hypothetical protein
VFEYLNEVGCEGANKRCREMGLTKDHRKDRWMEVGIQVSLGKAMESQIDRADPGWGLWILMQGIEEV